MNTNRRDFFRFLAASTALAPSVRAQFQQLAHAQSLGLNSAQQALQVTDFEEIARQQLGLSHWGFMSTGVDDDRTMAANVQAFGRIGLRPRRLVDVSKVDLSTQVLGETWQTPLFLCPVGSQRWCRAYLSVSHRESGKAYRGHHAKRRRLPPGGHRRPVRRRRRFSVGDWHGLPESERHRRLRAEHRQHPGRRTGARRR